MLKINDKYSIGTDSMNIILYETGIVEKLSTNPKKRQNIHIGEKYERAIGYFATIKGCLDFIIEHDIKGEGLNDFQKIVDTQTEHHQMISRITATLSTLQHSH